MRDEGKRSAVFSSRLTLCKRTWWKREGWRDGEPASTTTVREYREKLVYAGCRSVLIRCVFCVRAYEISVGTAPPLCHPVDTIGAFRYRRHFHTIQEGGAKEQQQQQQQHVPPRRKFPKNTTQGIPLACALRSVKLDGVVLVWLRSLQNREGWQPWK